MGEAGWSSQRGLPSLRRLVLRSGQCGSRPPLLLPGHLRQWFWPKVVPPSLLSVPSGVPHTSSLLTLPSLKKGRGSENQWETLSFLLYRLICFIHFMHLPRDRNGLEAQIFLSPLILSPGSQILFSLGLKDLEDKRAIRVT